MHCMHYCVMLSVIACCVSPFLLNLFFIPNILISASAHSICSNFSDNLSLTVLIKFVLNKKKGINFEEPHTSKEIDHLGVRPFKRGHVLKFSYLVQFTKR